MKVLAAVLNFIILLATLYQRYVQKQDDTEKVEAAADSRSKETAEIRNEIDASVAGLDRPALDERLRRYQRKPQP